MVAHSPTHSKYLPLTTFTKDEKEELLFPYLAKEEMEMNHSESKRIQRHVVTGLETLLEQTVLALS